MGVLGGKIGEGVVRYWPQRTRSYFSRFSCLCQFWWKSIQKCDRESAHRWTDRQTDANRFYNLSHAICYSYGTDQKWISFKLTHCYEQCLFNHTAMLKTMLTKPIHPTKLPVSDITNLSTLMQQSKKVTVGSQWLNMMSKTFGQSTQQVQSYNHEVFVWRLVCIWIWTVSLQLHE